MYINTRLFNKLFNIRPGEWSRLLLLYLMAFVVTTGLVWGETIVSASFLQQVGVRALPWFFMTRAVISIPAVVIYTAFADRVANDKLLIGILGIGIFGILSGLVLFIFGLPSVTYPLLYLLIYVPLADIFAAHWYTYVNGFYDTRSAKRIVPVLGTAIGVASIVGGLTMPTLNRFFSPMGIILLWLSTLVIMAILAWILPYILGEERLKAEASTESEKTLWTYIENLREGYRYVFGSTYLRWLAVASLLAMLLLVLTQYQTSQIVLNQLRTTENMSNFFGQVVGISNLIVLPLQLILLSRVIGRIGLGNANLIFPGGMLLISGGLIFWPGLVTAGLAYFGIGTFFSNIGYPIDSLLYNAVPLRVKGRARAFIGGLILPFGSLLGGLLLVNTFVAESWLLPAMIGLIAILYFGNALILRRLYGQALIQMLEQEDFSSLFLSDVSALTVTDPATLQQLQKKLEQSESYEFTIFMATLITQIGGEDAIPILSQAAHVAADARHRVAIIDALVAADIRDKRADQLYTEFLDDPAPTVRRAAIVGLKHAIDSESKQFLDLALKVLSDSDVEVQAQALPALLVAENSTYQTPAILRLNQLLESDDPSQRVWGIRVLHASGDLSFVNKLTQALADSEGEVRLQAALAIEEFSQRKPKLSDSVAGLFVDAIYPRLKDPIERVRQAALIVLGRLGGQQLHPAIATALSDPSRQVRMTAADVLVRVGKAAIPTVHPRLDSPDPQLRKMAAVILSRINRQEFGPLVDIHITGNLLTIYRHYNYQAVLKDYSEYAGISILQSMLSEQNQEFIEEIFYLLGAVHNTEAVNTIAESLRNGDERVRANAIEALEALTTPQTSRLVAPLFEPAMSSEQLFEVSQSAWDMSYPDIRQIIEQFIGESGDAWLRGLTIFILGEMAVALQNTSPKIRGGHSPKQRKRSRKDLFSLLATESEQTENDPEKPIPFTLPEIEEMIEASFADPMIDVRLAARAARRMMAGLHITDLAQQEDILLSVIEKITFLKEVPFFQSMSVDQLRVLANVCEEELFEEDVRIFNQGDPGGAIYVVVSGKVGIEQEKRKGSYARLATVEPHSYFGEMNLFDNSPRSASAIALQDTLVLRLRREPLIALARQYPDLSLELINVLSQRLREANDRIAELTRTRPRELHKLFDTFD